MSAAAQDKPSPAERLRARVAAWRKRNPEIARLHNRIGFRRWADRKRLKAAVALIRDVT